MPMFLKIAILKKKKTNITIIPCENNVCTHLFPQYNRKQILNIPCLYTHNVTTLKWNLNKYIKSTPMWWSIKSVRDSVVTTKSKYRTTERHVNKWTACFLSHDTIKSK